MSEQTIANTNIQEDGSNEDAPLPNGDTREANEVRAEYMAHAMVPGMDAVQQRDQKADRWRLKAADVANDVPGNLGEIIPEPKQELERQLLRSAEIVESERDEIAQDLDADAARGAQEYDQRDGPQPDA